MSEPPLLSVEKLEVVYQRAITAVQGVSLSVKPGQIVTEQELIDHCTKNLAGYEVPRRYAFVKEIPKTTVGKTLRRDLIQMELEEQEKAVTET